MGADVGVGVGRELGEPVGYDVGIAEGRADGRDVGTADGGVVGEAEGSEVGPVVGFADGHAVGENVGLLLGSGVGTTVGAGVCARAPTDKHARIPTPSTTSRLLSTKGCFCFIDKAKKSQRARQRENAGWRLSKWKPSSRDDGLLFIHRASFLLRILRSLGNIAFWIRTRKK